jgi:hypothetical protein
MVCNRRPEAGILDIPAKCLESKTPVGPSEQVDAPVVLAILEALHDQPRFVDARGHGGDGSGCHVRETSGYCPAGTFRGRTAQ